MLKRDTPRDARCLCVIFTIVRDQTGPPGLPGDLQPRTGAAVRAQYWKHSGQA